MTIMLINNIDHLFKKMYTFFLMKYDLYYTSVLISVVKKYVIGFSKLINNS